MIGGVRRVGVTLPNLAGGDGGPGNIFCGGNTDAAYCTLAVIDESLRVSKSKHTLSCRLRRRYGGSSHVRIDEIRGGG